jgi:transcriptional regulator with XRE-family HTH domain
MSEANAPYMTLGRHLRYVREQSQQSLAEVSGAVEIDEKSLSRIEAGAERPSEDILLLLISHFSIDEHEALKLWELAEYEGEVPEQIRLDNGANGSPKTTVMLLAFDMRVQYSDGIEIDHNKAGISMHFTQAAGQSKAVPVARIGMSHEQAEQVLRELQQTLQKVHHEKQPKALPEQSNNKTTHNESSDDHKNIEDTAL